MQAKIQEYLHEVASAAPSNAQEAEALRLRFLGRKGVMNDLFADFKTVAPDARKEVGQLLNQLKTAVESKVSEFANAKPKVSIHTEDVTRPA